MSQLFSFKDVSKTYGDDTLFSSLTVDFKSGEQLGLIGMNGSGKSTFLKLIAGLTEPDEGSMITAPGLNIVYIPQEDEFEPEQSVENILFKAARRRSLDEKECHKTVMAALGKAGFDNPAQVTENLSGGWKKKLAVTKAICQRPDLLLMDEPTNHLDINGILWLEEILKTAPFSFILVSHDRSFLENCCANVMEIGRYYPGGFFKIQGQYQKFEKERKKFLDAQARQQASLASKMRREDEWLRQGAKARSTKAKYRIEQAENLRDRLNTIKERNRETAQIDLDFNATGRQTKKLIQIFNLKQEADERILFRDISFELGPKACLGVVGPNGSGKSTFLSILAKEKKPDEGKVIWAENLKIALYDQTRSALNPEAALKEALNPAGGDSVNYKGNTVHIVTWAKRFLFMPDQLDMKVRKLSGGEKARVLLANIMLSPCDILLLDEPTNDLDIMSLEVLEQNIQQFPGAVILVSHDRYLMNRVCDSILYLDPDRSDRDSAPMFFRNFDQILNYKTDLKKTPSRDSVKKEKEVSDSRPSRVAFTYKEKYELEHIEEKISDQEKTVASLSDQIQDPATINDPARMQECCTKLEKEQNRLDFLYERWEYLENKKSGL